MIFHQMLICLSLFRSQSNLFNQMIDTFFHEEFLSTWLRVWLILFLFRSHPLISSKHETIPNALVAQVTNTIDYLDTANTPLENIMNERKEKEHKKNHTLIQATALWTERVGVNIINEIFVYIIINEWTGSNKYVVNIHFYMWYYKITIIVKLFR